MKHVDLMPLVYDELRRIAARYIGRERPGQTLQATALVNEAYVRLAAERPREFANRKAWESREDTRTRPVWDTIWSLLIVLALLGAEWLLRKRARLV